MSDQESFFDKCKAVAVLITAVAGFTLGILNYFKEETKAKIALAQAKAGYAELGHQVEALSKDLQYLAKDAKNLQDQISALQNWVLYSSSRRNATPGTTEIKIMKSYKTQKPVSMPAPRKPARWDVLQSGKAE